MRHIPYISYRKEGETVTITGHAEVAAFFRSFPYPIHIIAIG